MQKNVIKKFQNSGIIEQKTDSVINQAINTLSSQDIPKQCGGRNCVYNVTSAFGDNSTTKENKDFVKNVEKYGFKFIKASDPNSPYDFTGVQPGDIMLYWRPPKEENKLTAKTLGWLWTKNPFNSAYIPTDFTGYYPHHAALVGDISNDSTSAIIHDTNGSDLVRHRDFKSVVAPALIRTGQNNDLGYRTFYRFQGTPEQLKQWNTQQQGGGLYYLGISNAQNDRKGPVGHGGLVHVDKDGTITIYDSGPFFKNNTETYNTEKQILGKYIENQNTSKIKKYFGYSPMNYRIQHPNFKATFNEDGSINLDELTQNLKTIHYKYAEDGNQVNLVSIPNLNIDAALDAFIKEANSESRNPYNILTNSCTSAACRAINAGTGNKYNLPTSFRWPSSFKNLPDVIDEMEKVDGVQIYRKNKGEK